MKQQEIIPARRGIGAQLAPNADNWLLWVLGAVALLFALVRPLPLSAYPALVDWRTVGALCGLLILTKGIELSGILQRTASRLLSQVRDMRRLALLLVVFSAGLSALVTNDVSLFLLVPLTCSLAAQARLPLARLVVLEALAVNAGSALTPIGNPQNLFLWQSSGMGFAAFVVMMAPVVAIMLVLLGGAVWWLVPRQTIELKPPADADALSLPWFAISGSLLLAFLVALAFHQLLPALLVVAALHLLCNRRVLARTDWTLLIIIGLMFVDLRQLAGLPAIMAVVKALPISHGLGTYLAGIVTSQAISNVPAAILLERYVHDLPALAAGVSVGGFGFFVGSLANIIALRLARAPDAFGEFHRIAIPFLLAATVAVGLLFLR
ncbi:MAG: citrate transporter [Nevskia sp.]|nr:citrate transporter [Nevskia sp.]